MKRLLGAKNCLYPMPTMLVGALVNGKPNYLPIAHVGIMDHGTLSVSLGKIHYTNAGIKEQKTFSINIPSVDLVKETDYCGLVSGKKVDKSQIFESFFGVLETAPMITACPLNMECQLVQTLDFPKHEVFIGQLAETHCDEQCLTDGVVDFSKIRPLLFIMNDVSYWTLGEKLARAWKIGKEFQPQEE